MKPTWKPLQKPTQGELSTKSRANLPDSAFAFPEKRKEPLTDDDHVRNAMARFDQVHDVTDQERDLAWANIQKAAEHFDIDVAETSWQQLGKRPHTPNPAHSRR